MTKRTDSPYDFAAQRRERRSQRQAQEAERKRIADANEALKQRLRERVNQQPGPQNDGPSRFEQEWTRLYNQSVQQERQQARRAQIQKNIRTLDNMIANNNGGPLPHR